MKAFFTMLKIELKLSIRDMNMVIFAICMPLIITVILGMIYQGKSAFEGASYSFIAQSFGALCSIAICAGGVMGLPLLIADYRHKKILKRFKVTPVNASMLLAVHVLIYTLYALASLVLVYITAALFFDYHMAGSWISFMGSYFLVILSMFSIGMMVGGLAPDMKIASTIASLLYFPMLIFSGTTLPYEVMPSALQKIAGIMPLTQGIKLLKASSLALPMDDVFFPIAVLAALSIICITLSIRFFRWE